MLEQEDSDSLHHVPALLAEPAAPQQGAPPTPSAQRGQGWHTLPLGNATILPTASTPPQQQTAPLPKHKKTHECSLMYLQHDRGASRGVTTLCPSSERQSHPSVHSSARQLDGCPHVCPRGVARQLWSQACLGTSLQHKEEATASPAQAAGPQQGQGLPLTRTGTETTEFCLKHFWKSNHQDFLTVHREHGLCEASEHRRTQIQLLGGLSPCNPSSCVPAHPLHR